MTDRCRWCGEATHRSGCIAALGSPYASVALPLPPAAPTAHEHAVALAAVRTVDPALWAALDEMANVAATLCSTPETRVRFAQISVRLERAVVAYVARTRPVASTNGAHP